MAKLKEQRRQLNSLLKTLGTDFNNNNNNIIMIDKTGHRLGDRII